MELRWLAHYSGRQNQKDWASVAGKVWQSVNQTQKRWILAVAE